MSSGLYSITTRASGTVLTASIYNADHQNHVTNQNPLMTGAYSDNVAQMQTQTTPGAVGTESLAGSLGGELERIRFVLAQILGTAFWYDFANKILFVQGPAGATAHRLVAFGDTTGKLVSDATASSILGGYNFTGQLSTPEVALPAPIAAAITIDMSTGNNFGGVIGANFTLANPINPIAGQSGVIRFTQDATGSRTVTFGTNWKFPNGIKPALSTAANAVDYMFYYFKDTTTIVANMLVGVA